METLEEVRRALERLSAGDRFAITRWLQELPDTTQTGFGVAEPKASYVPVDPPFMTLEEYFEFEERSETRHEYVDGVVFAMAGASVVHERICHRLAIALANHIGRGPCQVFQSGIKLLIQRDASDICYYPDVTVDCRRDAWGQHFVRSPKLIVETLSPSTSLTDRREKFQNYRRVESLEEYALVAQQERSVTIYRRANNWRPDVYTGSGAPVEFRAVGLMLPLSEIYDDILV